MDATDPNPSRPLAALTALPDDTLHPDLTPRQRRRLIREGIERFNTGRYYDAHESWEEVWRSTTPEPADLWRGLIQIAVGLYHFEVRNKPAPARRVLARGLDRVERFPQGSEGLDLERLCREGRAWHEWLDSGRGDPPPRPRLRLIEIANTTSRTRQSP